MSAADPLAIRPPHLLAPCEDGFAVWLLAPVPCALCGAAHMFFRQRDGRTRCALCDLRYLDSGRQVELLEGVYK